MDLGRLGLWSLGLRSEDPARRQAIRDAAAEVEELGYGTVWLGSSPSVRHAAPLIEATSRLVVATGVLVTFDHDPADVAAQYTALAKDHPDRFLLGLGAGHADPRPYSTMLRFLDELDAGGVPKDGRVLAALGPKMLAAARDRTAGAHPYLVTPQHTGEAREILGEGPVLAPEVKVVLDADLDRARATARGHLAIYLRLPNYLGSLRRLGFDDADFQNGGSDRLLDATFALGDVDAVARRVEEHFAAGADHAALQVIKADRTGLPLAEWRELAALTRG